MQVVMNNSLVHYGDQSAIGGDVALSAMGIVMKIAMIRVDRELKKRNMKSRIVLQIHDELLVETERSEVEAVKALLEEQMKGAADLKVALEVDAKVGDSWFAAK